jgi:outer membrane protein insertion porin family
MKFATQFELIIPTPVKFAASTRVALFYDVGNVFSTGGVTFFDRLGEETDEYMYRPENLKQSVGIGVEWLAPLGLLKFSYSMPLNATERTERFYEDETEEFQFTVGNAF